MFCPQLGNAVGRCHGTVSGFQSGTHDSASIPVTWTYFECNALYIPQARVFPAVGLHGHHPPAVGQWAFMVTTV